MVSINHSLNNTHVCVHTHEDHNIIFLELINNIKLCMKEDEEEGGDYFLRLTQNNIEQKTGSIYV